MELIKDYIQVRDFTIRIRSFKEKFYTNLYLNETKCNLLISRGALSYVDFEKTIFILHRDHDFYHLYFISSSFVSLEDSLNNFKKKYNDLILVTDLVGDLNYVNPLLVLFKNANFSIYTKLIRMNRLIDSDTFIQHHFPIIALPHHAIKIQLLLEKYFDKYCEQIPLIEELYNWINAKTVFIIEEKNDIVGFVIFEINGYTSYLRYWFTHPDYRNLKIGSRLLRSFFFECRDTKRQLFWVIDTNDNAIKRYEHYGFNSEQMFDLVMINK